jgi:hypothetical protein
MYNSPVSFKRALDSSPFIISALSLPSSLFSLRNPGALY